MVILVFKDKNNLKHFNRVSHHSNLKMKKDSEKRFREFSKSKKKKIFPQLFIMVILTFKNKFHNNIQY